MNISDLNYLEEIKEEEKLGTVVGGWGGLLGGLFGFLFGGYGYNQQPTTIVNNYITVENNSSSTSSSGSSAGASAGSPSGSPHK